MSSASATAVVASKPEYRFDLDGLRAFAIVLVVIYHVWVGRVSGGVDVFLLLSAYFMTASLVKRGEASLARRRENPGEKTGGLKLGAFYARRFWRLVPAAAATIALTLVAVYYFFPKSSWPAAWSQSLASLFYVQNWELAFNSIDYYERDANSVTPFLHFWSLSIQGQIFVLWPLLIGLCWLIARMLRRRMRTITAIVFALVFAVSLTYSIITTAETQAFAYFDTGARLWEFAIGSLVALIPLSFRLPRAVAEILGWLALVGIISCGIVLDVSGGFPGYLALWPTLCAAALIVAGRARTSFTIFLGSAPLRWLGRIAYSLYLVHWPILTTYIVLTNNGHPGLRDGALIIGAAFVLAVIIHYGVEKPLGAWKWPQAPAWRGYLATASIFALVAGGTIAWQVDTERKAAEVVAQADNPGAESLLGEQTGEFNIETMIPPATALGAEAVVLGELCPDDIKPRQEKAGSACSSRPGNDGSPRVAFVGNSHAEQWMGAVLPVLDDVDVKVMAMLEGGCTFAPDAAEISPQCYTWVTETNEALLEDTPEVIFLMGTYSATGSPDEVLIDGIGVTADRLATAGAKVVLMRDNPRFTRNMYTCIEENVDDLSVCSTPLSESLAPVNPAAELDESINIYTLDVTEFLCPDEVCPAVIGNVAVYVDDNHMSWSFARTLAPMVADALDEAGLRWPTT